MTRHPLENVAARAMHAAPDFTRAEAETAILEAQRRGDPAMLAQAVEDWRRVMNLRPVSAVVIPFPVGGRR